jgi:prevent-host-death family protein
MKTINVQEAKTHLSRLMERAASGETIILGKHGKPMVKLTAYEPGMEARRIGGLEGDIWIDSDFDAEDPRINALFLGSEG